MKLIISTQVRENYGAHDWDGEGSCPQYWKYKGGSEYAVAVNMTDILANENISEYLEQIAVAAGDKVTDFNDYFEEYVVNWSLEEDDYMTQFQKDCLEYEGHYKPLQELAI